MSEELLVAGDTVMLRVPHTYWRGVIGSIRENRGMDPDHARVYYIDVASNPVSVDLPLSCLQIAEEDS